MKIKKVRPVLLSAPYAKKGENMEVDLHLPSGYKTTGMVELTLEDGTTGLGEAYLAVFAPKVFVEIVNTITPYIIDQEIDNISDIMNRVSLITGYWSAQGAAQHVISAFDIALHDSKAKLQGIPVYRMLNKNSTNSIELYGSGGDSPSPKFMDKELDQLNKLGIKHFKIRARNEQTNKACYVLQKAGQNHMDIAIDMTQNLTNPGQNISEIIDFYKAISGISDTELFFLEEVLGLGDIHLYPDLRDKITVKIAGGEIVTTVQELGQRIEKKWYDIAQPDATVIGGISSIEKIFKHAADCDTEVYVHCWGGPVSMAANYHAAVAYGGKMAEWPMPYYPLRDAMMVAPWEVQGGILTISETPGLGVRLTNEIEEKYKFKESAVYSCIAKERLSNEEVWQ